MSRAPFVLLALASTASALGCSSCEPGPSVSSTGGDKSRGVEGRLELGPEERRELVSLARRAVEERVRNGGTVVPSAAQLQRWPRLAEPGASFVTLKISGSLRGCIGSLAPVSPLAHDVAENAVRAAVSDARFLPVTAEELERIDLSISVLEAPRPLVGVAPSDLPRRLGETRPGLVLKYAGRRSTFLPSVWEELPQPEQFLSHLCQKQGSPETCWRSPEASFDIYGAQVFGEKQP